MNALQSLINACDLLLIAPFRWPDSPEAGFLLGTAVLALVSALVGRASLWSVAFSQRAKRLENDQEVASRQALSFQALAAKDKTAYLAQNELAKDAYGFSMALAAGRGAALLWPGAAALTWLSWRFSDTPLPLVGEGWGPAAFFIPLYLLANLIAHLALRTKNKTH